MSADNGIYILATSEGQYRVVHTQAIDSLYWDYKTKSSGTEPVSTRIVEVFGKSKATKKRSLATHIAEKMAKDYPYIEYGISFIKVEKPWSKIVSEAKKFAHIEMETLCIDNQCGISNYAIEKLKTIMEMRGQRIT